MLANKVCVISEDCSCKKDLESYKDAILIPKNTDEMIRMIKELLNNPDKLEKQSQNGYELFTQLSLKDWIQKLL